MKVGGATLASGLKERNKILEQQMGVTDMHQKEDKSLKRALANKGMKKLAKKARLQRLAEEQ